MQGKLTYKDETGKNVECDVIAVFKNGGNDYIAYTDNKVEDGKRDLLVSKYKTNGAETQLIPIEDDTEWNFVEEYLTKNLLEKGDEVDD